MRSRSTRGLPRSNRSKTGWSKTVFGGAGVKLVYALMAGLFASNVAMGLALFWSPDIAALLDHQQDNAYGVYEDRITQLRLEVDRLHSRQYARAGDINLQMQDLMQQQELLSEQHEYVRTLANMAEQLGLETEAVVPPRRPEIFSTSSTLLDGVGGPDPVAAVAGELDRMQVETLDALTALSDAAESSTREILSEMNRIGLDPQIEIDATALGGPFEPSAGELGASPHIAAANAVIEALARYELVRDTALQAPVHRPLAGTLSISSSFGTRTDPFNGRSAFHSGLDFRGARGTDVLAAGAGKVVFAGRNGGYGNMVDIEHINGLVTRYGHMSRIAVREGQTVSVGDIIGYIGSTGRSTGPHLHFEVRRDDQAVDPGIYLSAGRRLASLI